jgi:hypothetical protein
MTEEKKAEAPELIEDKELDEASGGLPAGPSGNNLKQLGTAATPAAANTYRGTTQVNQGVLQNNPAKPGDGSV